jgi:hypothetical protein
VKRGAVVLVVLILAGCATTCPPPASPRIIDTACQWVHPVTVAATDSPETIRQAVALKQTIDANCPKK